MNEKIMKTLYRKTLLHVKTHQDCILGPYVLRKLKTSLDQIMWTKIIFKSSRLNDSELGYLHATVTKVNKGGKLFLRSPCRKRVPIKACYDVV